MRIARAALPGEGQANAMRASGDAVPIPGGDPHGTRVQGDVLRHALSSPALSLNPDPGPCGVGLTLILSASVEGAACLARME
jgi:hypothetical protein